MITENHAFVHPEAQIGANVVIDPFAYVDKNVVIGDGTHIYAHACVLSGTRIGKNCNIYHGAVVGGIPQDLKFVGEDTTVEIGDNNNIREFATIHRGTASKGKTVIGNNCLIMAYCHVAHDCVLHNNIIMSNAVQLAGEVVVDDFAIISGGALVHQFTRIGAHCMVQGGSKINKDIPPYSIVGRDPVSYCGINSVGLRRRNFSAEQINTIQNVYRYLYLSGKNVSDALESIKAELPETPERDMIVNFVSSSERGIVRGGII